jgi:hypothetical protein
MIGLKIKPTQKPSDVAGRPNSRECYLRYPNIHELVSPMVRMGNCTWTRYRSSHSKLLLLYRDVSACPVRKPKSQYITGTFDVFIITRAITL